MNSKDLDFMKTFFLGLENKGVNLNEKNMFYLHVIRNAIRSFYGFSRDKTVTDKLKHLISEDIFEFQGLDIVLTESAKKRFKVGGTN